MFIKQLDNAFKSHIAVYFITDVGLFAEEYFFIEQLNAIIPRQFCIASKLLFFFLWVKIKNNCRLIMFTCIAV